LNRGTVPIFEPGLADLIANNMREGRLAFTSGVSAAVSQRLCRLPTTTFSTSLRVIASDSLSSSASIA
jgi:UDP-glucose 6-dehydrogenase